MELVKMLIVPEVDRNRWGEGFKVLFNPNRLSYSKSLAWEAKPTALSAKATAKPKSQLNYDSPATLSVPLFFDTTESAGGGLFPRSTRSVLDYTLKVQKLAQYLPEVHRPPVCKLFWGKAVGVDHLLFKGVMKSLEQNFLLFLEDGTPIRAELNCTFVEFSDRCDSSARGELHSPDVSKKYVVKPGDTLINVAAALYRDGSLWRTIAEANGIENPRALSPGQVLDVPPLR